MKAQNKYEKVSLQRGDRWQALDPATLAIALKPDLVDEYKYAKNDITLCGKYRQYYLTQPSLNAWARDKNCMPRSWWIMDITGDKIIFSTS